MHDLLKGIWIVLWIFTLLGVLSLIPLDKYERIYVNELRRVKSEPQRRVDATYRYIEAVEEGNEDISNGIFSDPPAKYYDNYDYNNSAKYPLEKVKENKYSRPLYIRDKYNPKILYPYPRSRWY